MDYEKLFYDSLQKIVKKGRIACNRFFNNSDRDILIMSKLGFAFKQLSSIVVSLYNERLKFTWIPIMECSVFFLFCSMWK